MLKMKETENKPFSMPSNIIPTEIFNRHARTHLLCHIYCDNVSNNKAKTIGLEVSWLVGVVMLAGWVWGIYERTAADPESRVHTSTLDLHRIICSPNTNRYLRLGFTSPSPHSVSPGWIWIKLLLSVIRSGLIGNIGVRPTQYNLSVLLCCFPRSQHWLEEGVEICPVSV